MTIRLNQKVVALAATEDVLLSGATMTLLTIASDKSLQGSRPIPSGSSTRRRTEPIMTTTPAQMLTNEFRSTESNNHLRAALRMQREAEDSAHGPRGAQAKLDRPGGPTRGHRNPHDNRTVLRVDGCAARHGFDDPNFSDRLAAGDAHRPGVTGGRRRHRHGAATGEPLVTHCVVSNLED
jgi:hypothetical protein